ncbi:MAG: ABC transporter permease subunit [Candidatus Competibacteraceae bacterium]
MRAERLYPRQDLSHLTNLEVKVPPGKRLLHSDLLQKFIIGLALAGVWEAAADYIHHHIRHGQMLFPKFSATVITLGQLLGTAEFWSIIGLTVAVLLACFVIGAGLAFAFSALSITTRAGCNFLELVVPPMSSLPAVALISAAILAFKSNLTGTVFVVSQAVFWTVLAATHQGFTQVESVLKQVGQNYGLSNTAYVCKILVPAALGSIITGTRLGIARAFQAFVAVELVLGSVYGSGALGFFIAQAKNDYNPPLVYAGLFTIMIISFLIDYVAFGYIEKKTIIKWGIKNLDNKK